MNSFYARIGVIVTTVALMIGVSAPAYAQDYPWPHNGCTSAPERVTGADFTHPCNQHDGCYAKHWADRATCDQWFWNDMIKECKKAHFDLVTGCSGTAGVYYSAVRIFGGKFYDSGGEQVRIETPTDFA